MEGRHSAALLAFMTWVGLTLTQVTFEGTDEYCNMEIFNVTCDKGEVIYMISAMYGRMKEGRCITKHYGHLGCSSNVLPYFDKECSGSESCVVPVPDPYLHDTKPCPKDFQSYLEVSYECVRVARHDAPCDEVTKLHKTLDAGEGFLVGAKPDHPEDPANIDCGIHIRAQPGQTINLTLISFGSDTTANTGDNVGRQCVDVAHVVEGDKEDRLNLCPFQDRTKVAYSSDTNELVLRAFSDVHTDRKKNLFLWKYTAVGCPDLDIPANLWVRRPEKGQLMAKCNQTEETWYLVCQNGAWKGKIGNCSQSRRVATEEEQLAYEESAVPYGILITIIIGVALGVFLGGILLVVVFAFRRYHKPARHRVENPYDLRDKKPIELDMGYAPVPVLDECGHFPVCPERYPSYNGGTINPRTAAEISAATATDGLTSGVQIPLDCIPNVPCVHHDCHIYETTRRAQQQQQQAHMLAAEVQQQNQQNQMQNSNKTKPKQPQPTMSASQQNQNNSKVS